VRVWSDFCAAEDVDAGHAYTMIMASAVLPCVTESGACSFSATGLNHTAQEFWLCDTCGTEGGIGCCSACRKSCHRGHKLVKLTCLLAARLRLCTDLICCCVLREQRRSPFGDADSYCDCGAGGYKKRPCKSLRQFDCDKAKAGAAPAAAPAASTAAAGTGLSEATLALGNLKL
jgi:hypothetical protein